MVLKAVYLVLNHDISSRVCDVALNIVECLLQLGVVPCVEKVRRKSENKENEAPEKRPSEGSFQLKGAASGGSACGFGAPPVSGAGDGGEEGGGGSGGGGGGGSDGGGGGGPYEKNDKNQEKVCLASLYTIPKGTVRSVKMEYVCVCNCPSGFPPWFCFCTTMTN